ncbi:MAG: DUF523 and DUF1722 domain-containing protein [Deltaproteobacteria bacterium]|nr:DUF523 and DUF1722 domain-containing protein [Deltaproteobacteria bacterium]
MVSRSTYSIYRPDLDTHPVPRVGVSRCLVGDPVRYDGGHKKDAFVTDTLGKHVDLIPVCPEVEMGLPVPRESIRLENRNGAIRLIAPASGTDWTRQATDCCARRISTLSDIPPDGFIVQKKSPSCGLAQVKVFTPGQPVPQKTGTGIFTAALSAAFPQMPLIDCDQLHNPVHRRHFLEQVFASRRLAQLFDSGAAQGKLVAFHSQEKYLLLAHDEAAYRGLGKLVAHAGETSFGASLAAYRSRFMAAMNKVATPATHTNVLQHIAGYFKKSIGKPAREQLTLVIDEYHAGRVPLAAPIDLLRDHARRQSQTYLLRQTYLAPYPEPLWRLDDTGAPPTNQ